MMSKVETAPRKHATVHIRAALDAAFPGAQFRVRKRYAIGADAYHISWPGTPPSHEQVRELADRLQADAEHRVVISCQWHD
jgi:hypothetical protein